MANKTNQNVITGVVLNILIGGQAVGLIQTGDGRRTFGTEGVYGIGGINGQGSGFMPGEHVQLRFDGTFTVDKFFIRIKDLQKLGLAALGEDILDLGVLDIEVKDVVKGTSIRVYKNCTLSDYTETFRTNAIAGENATWNYLTCIEKVA